MKRSGHVFIGFVVAAGCGFPRPSPVGGADDGGGGDTPTPACMPSQSLRCDGSSLVSCNGDGTAEVPAGCSLGCSVSPPHCNDIDPSNGLARYIDMAAGEPDLDLGVNATVNTSDGTVTVDGKSVMVKSALLAQANAPTILVFIVRSLTSGNVTITGSNALAMVSNGDITIGGVFAASANLSTAGPGRFNDSACRGGSSTTVSSAFGGAGGGGFGTAGATGGSATDTDGTSVGGAGGSAIGNLTLTPLRGGCDSGTFGGNSAAGTGGGAIQVVSRTKILISGVVAANGSSFTGGGSGGGILLEAPLVDVSGSVVANGGAGAGGCLIPEVGENGHLDAAPAMGGGTGCNGTGANGGNGAAGAVSARSGMSISILDVGSALAFGGGGGGGVGRIRINTGPGGFHRAGLFSPDPSTGAIATR